MGSGLVHRQERQIVQPRLNLRDFLPWFWPQVIRILPVATLRGSPGEADEGLRPLDPQEAPRRYAQDRERRVRRDGHRRSRPPPDSHWADDYVLDAEPA